MDWTILNPNDYTIRELQFETELTKKFIDDVKKIKKFICKRSETSNNETYNIESDFIIKELSRLKKNTTAFAIVIYQKVINFNIQSDKPTALLIARKGSRENTYILSLLCKYEGAIKGLGSILLNKLVEKAKKNSIKYIYVEATSNSYLFYKKQDFDSDSEKDIHTEEEKDETLFGYLYKINYDNDNNNNNDNIFNKDSQIGGKNNTINDCFVDICVFSNCLRYKYKLTGNVVYNLTLYNDNDEIIGKSLLEEWTHPNYLYVSLEIMKIESNLDMGMEILLDIIDNICKKNYVHKTFVLVEHDDDKSKIFYSNHEYEHKKDKMKLMMYEKIHNKTSMIDRTVLSIG
jgi:hypothetical protein